MQRDLEIDLLRSFVAIAAHRSFTRAAEAIGRTQSAVSLQLKRLEQITGERLFERSRNSVEITPTGEALLVHANRILMANEAALAHIRRPEAEGLIRFGAPDDYASYLLAPILAGFRAEYPLVEFELTCESSIDLVPMLEHGEIDIMLGTHQSDQVNGRIARYESLHWVAGPDYVDDPAKGLSLALFPQGCAVRHAGLVALEQIERPWRIVCSTRSVDLIEKTVLNGAGVSVMEASIIPGTLRVLDGQPGFPPLPEIAMSVHYNKAACPPHVGIFADYLVGELGKRRV
ncbi:LysR family transcriptional regulator [Hoeflea halophila]|uniref:LysR family transcriptional regulator n=1 Tax=Hoeflea halophila TaxID=714899 RepID=A0A286IBS3_9HYPH|nr:LysR substrate-binding domain-containing protein [Hoeflea halophila]SOE17568.1 LysR family transcriptional regulator [Hoeflea halophila]